MRYPSSVFRHKAHLSFVISGLTLAVLLGLSACSDKTAEQQNPAELAAQAKLAAEQQAALKQSAELDERAVRQANRQRDAAIVMHGQTSSAKLRTMSAENRAYMAQPAASISAAPALNRDWPGLCHPFVIASRSKCKTASWLRGNPSFHFCYRCRYW